MAMSWVPVTGLFFEAVFITFCCSPLHGLAEPVPSMSSHSAESAEQDLNSATTVEGVINSTEPYRRPVSDLLPLRYSASSAPRPVSPRHRLFLFTLHINTIAVEKGHFPEKIKQLSSLKWIFYKCEPVPDY